MLSVDEKIHTLKIETACISVKSIFSEHEAKNTTFSLKEDFVIVQLIMWILPANISVTYLL